MGASRRDGESDPGSAPDNFVARGEIDRRCSAVKWACTTIAAQAAMPASHASRSSMVLTRLRNLRTFRSASSSGHPGRARGGHRFTSTSRSRDRFL